jgi:hypothetical protein
MEYKDDAILLGPFIGEFYWCAGRFAPLLPFMRKSYSKIGKKVKFIVLTREERFDLYGRFADILVPLKIDGDYGKYVPNCYKLNDFPDADYQRIASDFKKKYEERFNILDHLYPRIDGKHFMNKNQFQINRMIFSYAPRQENYDLVDSYLPKDKPVVLLSPRYRNNNLDPPSIKRRNWPHWQELYSKIRSNNFLMDNFNFVICGKPGEYIPDSENKFFDINKIQITRDSSLSGLLLVVLKRTCFTCASQSAIPNLSLLFKVEVLEWGHQKTLHTIVYNYNRTKITFLDDPKYNLPVKVIYQNLLSILEKKIKTGEIKTCTTQKING